MLQVDLRELSGGAATTHAELGAADPLFEGLGLVLAGPVRVTGRLHAAGEGRFYWQASLRAQVAGECRRCLTPVPVAVVADIRALFPRNPPPRGAPAASPRPPAPPRTTRGPAGGRGRRRAGPRGADCRGAAAGRAPASARA